MMIRETSAPDGVPRGRGHAVSGCDDGAASGPKSFDIRSGFALGVTFSAPDAEA